MHLSITNATKRYGEFVALHPIQLEVEGEIFGIIGNNGAGKSTLLKMIVGLLSSGKGKIHLGELSVRESPEEVKQLIGYLPESPLLYPKLTPEELLHYVAEIRGLDDVSEEIEHWLNFFGLSEKRNALLGDLSFGMKKKISISAAFLGSPPFLILDEPFNGLDVATMEGLTEMIFARHRAGTTILISSHLMNYIDRLCHRVVILKRGRVVGEGRPKDLKKETGQDDFHQCFLHYMNLGSK